MSYACGTILIDVTEDNQNSTSIAEDPHFKRAQAIMISAPSSLDQTNVTVQSYDGTNWNNHQSGGSDITIEASDTATITTLGPTHFRVRATVGAENNDRTFTIRAVEKPRRRR